MGESKARGMRSSNIELMRIFLMLGIILHHMIVNSGITGLYDWEQLPNAMLYCMLVGGYGKMIINCFTLISGYYMVKSDISVSKFLKVYIPFKLYYAVFFIIFIITGYEPFSVRQLMITVFTIPYELGKGYYSGTFLVFFLFIPFLNILVRNMDKKNYQRLLMLLLLCFTILPTLFEYYFGNTFFFMLGWLMVVYLIGGYIRLYPCKYFESWRLAAVVSVLLFSANSVWVVCVARNAFVSGFTASGYLTSNCHKILAIAIAVALFLFFKNLHIPYSRVINTLAASTFGILLIHTNSDMMRRFLWVTLFRLPEHYMQGARSFIPYSILVMLSVYLGCFIIDYLRLYLQDGIEGKLLQTTEAGR